MLERVFEIVLNMSITASVAAVLIILFRLLLGNKLPKIFSYALWAIVLLRLFVPFYLPSKMSLFNAVRIPDSIIAQNGGNQKMLDNALPAADNKDVLQKNTAAADLNSSLPVKATKNPIDFKPESIIVTLWLFGAAGLLLFSAIAYIRASKRLKDAVLYKNDELLNNLCMKLKLGKKVRIYTSDRIDSPIVYGLVRAAVILPLSFSQSLKESELRHIIAHELVHIKRFDHIIKPLSVLALCIHWFNPLVWISFALSQKDMETACDEKVMSSFDKDIRSEYAGSLIKLAARQNLLLNGGVLAFGESNIKRRVKSIMNYKKPSFWIVIVMVAILTASSFALLTNGESKSADKNETTPKSLNTKTKPDYGNETNKKTSEQIQATRKTIDKLLSIITSPSASSSTGDYIKAYQKEADQIVDMGEKALPYLTEILDSGDKGLRGNVVWQLCERIIKNLSGNVQSPETEKLLKETITAVDKWKVSMGYDKVSDVETSDDLKKLEAQEDEMLSQAHALNSIIKKLSSSSNKYSGGNMKWPIPSSNQISSVYGMRYHSALHKEKEHTGIDIPASKDDSIVAANDGTVILADYKPGYGNTIIIDHGGSIATLYGHCSSFNCSVGDKVKAGEVIAKVGSTGLSTGPHCHFEVRVNGDTVNPLKYCEVVVK